MDNVIRHIKEKLSEKDISVNHIYYEIILRALSKMPHIFGVFLSVVGEKELLRVMLRTLEGELEDGVSDEYYFAYMANILAASVKARYPLNWDKFDSTEESSKTVVSNWIDFLYVQMSDNKGNEEITQIASTLSLVSEAMPEEVFHMLALSNHEEIWQKLYNNLAPFYEDYRIIKAYIDTNDYFSLRLIFEIALENDIEEASKEYSRITEYFD